MNYGLLDFTIVLLGNFPIKKFSDFNIYQEKDWLGQVSWATGVFFRPKIFIIVKDKFFCYYDIIRGLMARPNEYL